MIDNQDIRIQDVIAQLKAKAELSSKLAMKCDKNDPKEKIYYKEYIYESHVYQELYDKITYELLKNKLNDAGII